MDDLEELAEAMGRDVAELYREIRADVAEEVRAERSLERMLHAVLLLLRSNPKHCRICLELIDAPEKSVREISREIGVSSDYLRYALVKTKEVAPEIVQAVEMSRVLYEGVGRSEVVRARSTHTQNMKG